MSTTPLPLRTGRELGIQLPPPSLPTAHFAAATSWLVAGAAGILLAAPQIAGGLFLHPRLIAVTHMFTLGVITTSIFGALYQIFPVALGVSARSIRVAHVTGLLLQCGTLAMVLGAWFWRPNILALGWLLIFAAVGGLSWNLLPQRRRATRGRIIGLYVSGAHMALGFAMLIAAALIGEKLQWFTVNRFGLLSAHAHLAVLGFATLTITGTSVKLLPMFLQSRGQMDWPLRWIGPMLGTGLAAFSVGSVATIPFLTAAGAWPMAASGILQVIWISDCFRTRSVPRIPTGLHHIAAATVFLVCAIVIGTILLMSPSVDARLVIAYGVLGIIGWLTLYVVGVWHRILPVLVWTHRFAPSVGRVPVPTIEQLRWNGAAWGSAVALPAGTMLLAAGAKFGSDTIVLAAAGCLLAGALLVTASHIRLAAFRRPTNEKETAR